MARTLWPPRPSAAQGTSVLAMLSLRSWIDQVRR